MCTSAKGEHTDGAICYYIQDHIQSSILNNNWSVHEICCTGVDLQLFSLLEGKLDACQADEYDVKSVHEEN